MFTMFTCLTGNYSIVLKTKWTNWSGTGFRKRVLLWTVWDYTFVKAKSQNNSIYRIYFDLPTEFSYQWENARQKLPALLCIVLFCLRCCIAWYWFTLKRETMSWYEGNIVMSFSGRPNFTFDFTLFSNASPPEFVAAPKFNFCGKGLLLSL